VAYNEFYNADSGLVTVASSSQTAIFEMRSSGTTNKRAWVTGIRVAIGNTAVGAGNNSLFTLARAGNSPSGGSSVTPSPLDAASPASITGTFKGGWTIAPTVGTLLAEWQIPQSSGSMWVEYPALGMEWVMPVATASVAMFVTNSSATSTPIQVQFIFAE
jgi:hypothetical protein